MTDIFKKFLMDDGRRLSPTGRFIGLAAFGKHPGWDDHVEDLGLETDSLNQAKTVFYVNGIGGQIDSGAWEKLDAAQQLPAFKHVFLWQRSGQILLGRLWSSSDGKGRKRYPMVVCLHFIGVSLRWALRQGLPALAELEDEIKKTNSAEEVRAILSRKRAALRDGLASAESGGEYAPVSAEALKRILHPSGDGNSQGFLRVLYQMQSQFRNFAPGNRTRGAAPRPQQIRVPAGGENPEEILLFWTRFFQTQVDASVPLLICAPLEGNWADVTAGDPESHEFFALRASPKAVPLVSEVPYTLDEQFVKDARGFLETFERGEMPGISAKTTHTASAEKPASASKGGLLKWLGVGCVVAVGIAATAVFLNKKGGVSSPQPEARADAKITASNPAARVEAAVSSSTPKPPPASATAPSEPTAKPIEVAKTPSNSESVAAAVKMAETNIQATAAVPAQKDAVQSKPLETLVKPAEARAAAASDATDAGNPPAVPSTLATSPAPATTEITEIKTAASITPAPEIAVAAPRNTSPAGSTAPASGGLMTNSIGMVFVQIRSGLWVAKYETTWGEYARVMETANNDARLPVNRVSWDDANEFCRKLTAKESATLKGKVYSLPTAKQWEEFRAGQTFEELPAGSLKGSSQAASAVAETASNKLGLFGVLGNVWEWCLDDASGSKKLQKGGEYGSTNYDRAVSPNNARLNSGFRCVLISK